MANTPAHTLRSQMPKRIVTVSLDDEVVAKLDELVQAHRGGWLRDCSRSSIANWMLRVQMGMASDEWIPPPVGQGGGVDDAV